MSSKDLDQEKQELPLSTTIPPLVREQPQGPGLSGRLEKGQTLLKPLDWEGPDDPANPRNWPLPKRVFHTALPALHAFTITITTSVLVPSLPLIEVKFNVVREVAILGLSLYTVGLALGPLIAAPLSEIFGRRPIYLVCFVLLIAFTAGSGASQNIQQLLIFRFLAGTLGSGAIAIGAGTLQELWDPMSKGVGPALLLYTLGPFLGPTLGILTGAYTISEYHNDWRYSMWVILIIAAPIMLASLFMKETSKKQILHTRNKQRGLHVPDTNALKKLCRDTLIGLARPIRMLFTEPLVALLSIYTGFAFAMLFSFFGSYSYVFALVYHFNSKSVGLSFLGILVGFLFAITTFGIFKQTLYAKAVKAAKGRPDAEHNLYAGMLGSIIMPIGLFWFAWTAREDIHWIVPVLSGIPFGWGMLSIFLSSTVYLLDVYRVKTGASALAANGLLRFTLGAAFPLFTLQLYDRIGIHWAGSVFGFMSLLLMPVPWTLFKYGKYIRARSHYSTSEN